MSLCLLIAVRFNDGRFHGLPEWPPAPARLFQALLAGAARGRTISREAREALSWLERLPTPPLIAAPPARPGQAFSNFVPNNSLDAVGADPGRVGEIRTSKKIRPRLFGAPAPLLYCWEIGCGEDAVLNAAAACALASGLYQLGRGVDIAWAQGEVLDEPAAAERLRNHGGTVYLPSPAGAGALPLACPQPGSLLSLEKRWFEFTQRFASDGKGRRIFAQPGKPRFAVAYYGAPARRLLFELRAPPDASVYARWPPVGVARATEGLRDAAAGRLSGALPEGGPLAEGALVGRGAGDAAKRERARIIPLPSIGHEHADHQIRRVLVEVPPDCPIQVGDLRWAFTGLEIPARSPHLTEALLVPADDEKFLRHFGVGDEGAPSRLWRTVTPAALPWPHGSTRSGPARLVRDSQLGQAVRQALRHAGIEAPVESVRVQREPFDGGGDRAENFAAPPRFTAGRLWHVEVAFATPLAGPLVIGDGRYLGLGVMAPCREAWRAVLEFAIEAPSGPGPADVPAVTSAVRRALMARARELGNGSREIPRLFSGHESDGGAARSGRHEHIFIAACPAAAAGRLDRLLIAAPWACDKTVAPQGGDAAAFDRVASGLRAVTMGHAGVLSLAPPEEPRDGSRAVGPATVWASATPYRPTRHPSRGQDAAGAIISDIAAECRRRGLPVPRVELGAVRAGPKGGRPEAEARLAFSVAVRGPILLGRDSHLGGGLFLAEPIR